MITFGFRNKFSGWLRSITAIVIGVIIVAKPATSLVVVVKVLAAFLIASGIVSLVYGIINRARGVLGLMILNAIIVIAIGALIFAYPIFVADFMIMLIAILLVLFGIWETVVLASASRVVKLSMAFHILPVVCILCGVFLLINPFKSAVTLTLIAGISVLIYGVSEFIATWKMNRAMKASAINPAPAQDDVETAEETEFEKED